MIGEASDPLELVIVDECENTQFKYVEDKIQVCSPQVVRVLDLYVVCACFNIRSCFVFTSF